jgi:hypothetical protein
LYLVFFLSTTLAAAVVETIDADTFTGQVTRLDEKIATIKTDDGEKTISADDLSKIIFVEESRIPELLTKPNQTVVLSHAGDVLPTRANALRLEKSQLFIRPAEIGMHVQLPIKRVRTILLPTDGESPEDVQRRCAELQCTPGAKDLLLIAGKDDKWRKVPGTLVGMADGQIRFAYHGKERTVKTDRVCAILLARPAREPPAPRGWLKTMDGCVYAFEGIAKTDAYYALKRFGDAGINLSRDQTATICFRTDRLVYLAELKPTSVHEYGLFDKATPYRVNRSAGGSVLRLAGRRYETGLGLHSVCELTYDLGDTYRVFVATAGIDDAVRPNGDATLTILADGKNLLPETRLTGRDTPKRIRLDVRGAKTLTIRVDFGPDKLDVADHVDLTGARLVK